jgi:hypothetical protein
MNLAEAPDKEARTQVSSSSSVALCPPGPMFLQRIHFLKMAVFWDAAPCVIARRSVTLMVKAVSCSETSAGMYRTAQCTIPERSHLGISCCGNLPPQRSIWWYRAELTLLLQQFIVLKQKKSIS